MYVSAGKGASLKVRCLLTCIPRAGVCGDRQALCIAVTWRGKGGGGLSLQTCPGATQYCTKHNERSQLKEK